MNCMLVYTLAMILRLALTLARFLHNGRLRLLFLALIVLLVGGILLTYERKTDEALWYMQPALETRETNMRLPKMLDDVLLTNPTPIPGRSIFFVETSCRGLQRKQQKPGQSLDLMYNMLQLTARQACAIESAALHNPNYQVFLLKASPTYGYDGTRAPQQPPLIDAILSYKNVQLRQLNIWRYASGTPIEVWLKDGQLFRSIYLATHLADFLRFVTLYRYGGIYLDLDFVVLRSMEEVPPNYAGATSNLSLGNAAMNLGPIGFGHEIAESCLRDFQQNFNGSAWGNNGPGVITRVINKICGTNNITEMLENRKRCHGFNVFNCSAFYAVSWGNWRNLFDPQQLEQVMQQTNDSFLAHFWNRESKELTIKVGSGTPYEKIAEQHCPRAYAAAGEYF